MPKSPAPFAQWTVYREPGVHAEFYMPHPLEFTLHATAPQRAALPSDPENSLDAEPGISDAQLRRFNAAARTLNPAIGDMSAAQLAAIAEASLRSAPATGAIPFIEAHMRCAGLIRAMADDSAWPLRDAQMRRIGELLAFIDSETPPAMAAPRLARLCDALLVDIVAESMREELAQYAQFCRDREQLASDPARAAEAAALDRSAWEKERERQLRLEHQLRQVQGSTYAGTAEEYASTPPEREFHVM